MKTIIITSKNPVKINAVKAGFNKVFKGESFEFIGESVNSGVPDQPMSDSQTFTGAFNRVKNAKKKFPKADFWVGIEGGCEKTGDEMQAFAWVYIESSSMYGKAKSSTFFLPKKIIDLVKQGIELGVADDMVFNRKNSKQKSGTVGVLTGNLITRKKYYTEPVILALIPFKNKSLY